MLQVLFQRIVMSSLALAVIGILVHDTKFDQAITIALPVSAVTFAAGMAMLEMGDPHTHSERGSLGRAFNNGLPRLLPPDDRKRQLAKRHSQQGDIGMGGVIWPNPVR